MISCLSVSVFTARKRSLRRLCFHRSVSVHRGVCIPECNGADTIRLRVNTSTTLERMLFCRMFRKKKVGVLTDFQDFPSVQTLYKLQPFVLLLDPAFSHHFHRPFEVSAQGMKEC